MRLINRNAVQTKNNVVNEHWEENNKGFKTHLPNVLGLFSTTHISLMCNPTNNICLVGVSFDNDVQKN